MVDAGAEKLAVPNAVGAGVGNVRPVTAIALKVASTPPFEFVWENVAVMVPSTLTVSVPVSGALSSPALSSAVTVTNTVAGYVADVAPGTTDALSMVDVISAVGGLDVPSPNGSAWPGISEKTTLMVIATGYAISDEPAARKQKVRKK